MPTSVFQVAKNCTIDYVSPTSAYIGSVEVGLTYLGASKSLWRRAILDFDLLAVPWQGRALRPSDTLVSAELRLYVNGVNGGSGYQCFLERISRPAWVEAYVSWNNYDNGLAWTTAGADVATPPAAFAWTSPLVASVDHVIDATALVADAIASRGSYVSCRLRKDDESVTTTHHVAYASRYPLDLGIRPRLYVSYTSPDPREMLDAGHVSGRDAARPAPIARPAAPARPLRGVRAAARG